jgi:hypothetical protein
MADPSNLLWGNLLHLSFNMWEDRDDTQVQWRTYRDELQLDKPLWDDLTARMAEAGMNLLVLDLGDAVAYQSHPEIAVRQAWSPAQLRDELGRLRGLGLEPIPKLNFASTHDAWLKEYGRMVSTPRYYEVCADLIEEVCALFDRPRFFHLGMDEETCQHQRYYAYLVVRQHELYWHDFHYLCDQVERHGVRPWIWSDCIWHRAPTFVEQVSSAVLQSNWYYGLDFPDPCSGEPDREGKVGMPDAYVTLDQYGYDQIPTASNHSTPHNFGRTVEWCRQHLAPERLLGFLTAPWRPTTEQYRDHHLAAIDQVAAAMAAWG